MIPRRHEILASLSGAQVLSSLNALLEFTQLHLDPRDAERKRLSARTEDSCISFRIRADQRTLDFPACNAVRLGAMPLAIHLGVHRRHRGLLFLKSLEDHIEHLDKVLETIEGANIALSPTKCHLFYDSIVLLGHKVSRLRLSTRYEKVRAVLEIK